MSAPGTIAGMPEGFEEGLGGLGRVCTRCLRGFRWGLKTLCGLNRHVLVELRWRLGDEIMALPIFESLRAKYPADTLDVITNYPDLFENHPFVDRVNPARPKCNRFLLLRGAPRNVWRIEHVARLAGTPVPVSRPHLYFQEWATPQLARIPGGTGPLIALAPGASWPTKRWHAERWRDLRRVLVESGCRVVELGQGGESVGAGGVSFVGETSVREAACVLHHADLLVCCDSGLMHLALAAATPVVALFGPTDPGILIRDEPNFHGLQSTQECAGYWNRAEGDPGPGVCPWRHACCLDSISVEEVLGAIARRVTLPAPLSSDGDDA